MNKFLTVINIMLVAPTLTFAAPGDRNFNPGSALNNGHNGRMDSGNNSHDPRNNPFPGGNNLPGDLRDRDHDHDGNREYIGSPSYQIEDDQMYSQLKVTYDRAKNDAENAKAAVAKIAEELSSVRKDTNTFEQIIKNSPREIESQNLMIEGLNSRITNRNLEIKTLKEKLSITTVEAEKNDLIMQIARKQTEIESSQKQVADLQRSKQAQESSLNEARSKIDGARARLINLESNQRSSVQYLNSFQTNAENARLNFETYSNQLLIDVWEYNRLGARAGAQDGKEDGHDRAVEVSEQGKIIGQVDGNEAGLSDARLASYNLGLAEGRQRGINEGMIEGEKLGEQDAYVEYGALYGRAAGEFRANSPEFKTAAQTLGSEQGNKVGLENAITQGIISGKAKVDPTYYKEKESSTILKKTTINGPYGGLFERRCPEYSEERGRRHSLGGSSLHHNEIVRKAYRDGYSQRYFEYRRATYQAEIDFLYYKKYDEAYASARSAASTKVFNGQIENGKSVGYNEQYIPTRDHYRKNKRTATSQYIESITDKKSITNQDYLNSYNRIEANSFDSVNEQNRVAAFNSARDKTYNDNIVAKTEEGVKKRKNEIDNLYLNHPVLQYVSQNTFEGGMFSYDKSNIPVKKILSPDENYQPGETIFHNIVIKNYGAVANNVKVRSSSGAEVVLPAIPEKSEVTIKGAFASQIAVNAKLSKDEEAGITHNSVVVAQPSTGDFIQVAHYADKEKNILASYETRPFFVQYPVGVYILKSTYKIGPGGEGSENLFTFKDQSVRHINIEVFNNSVEYSSKNGRDDGPLSIELFTDHPAGDQLFVSKTSESFSVGSPGGHDVDGELSAQFQLKFLNGDLAGRNSSAQLRTGKINAKLRYQYLDQDGERKYLILGELENPMSFAVSPNLK